MATGTTRKFIALFAILITLTVATNEHLSPRRLDIR